MDDERRGAAWLIAVHVALGAAVLGLVLPAILSLPGATSVARSQLLFPTIGLLAVSAVAAWRPASARGWRALAGTLLALEVVFVLLVLAAVGRNAPSACAQTMPSRPDVDPSIVYRHEDAYRLDGTIHCHYSNAEGTRTVTHVAPTLGALRGILRS